MVKINSVKIRDESSQIIFSHNTCPICGFPLSWKHDIDLRDETSPDTLWYYMHVTLRWMNPLKYRAATAFGNHINQTNFEKFHMTDKQLTRHIGKPRLYYTPFFDGQLNYQSEFYELPAHNHANSVFEFTTAQIDSIFEPHAPDFKIRAKRFSEFLSVNNDAKVFACKECNLIYSVPTEIGYVFSALFTAKYSTIENGFYTMMFDCMRRDVRNVKHITVDEDKRWIWQMELWLYRSLILILAHNGKSMVKGRPNAQRDMWLRGCHSDMGCINYLTGQLIAAILYSRFDVELHFQELYQHFLSRLMPWVYSNQFASELRVRDVVTGMDHKVYPSCLWKWVFGEQVAGSIVRTEWASEPNQYWIPMHAILTVAHQMRDRFMTFVEDWIPIIGHAIVGSPHPNHAHQWIVDSLRFHFGSGRLNYVPRIKKMLYDPVLDDAGNLVYPSLIYAVSRFHSIEALSLAFKRAFPNPPGRARLIPFYRVLLHENLIEVVFPMMNFYAITTHNLDVNNWNRWRAALYWFTRLVHLA